MHTLIYVHTYVIGTCDTQSCTCRDAWLVLAGISGHCTTGTTAPAAAAPPTAACAGPVYVCMCVLVCVCARSRILEHVGARGCCHGCARAVERRVAQEENGVHTMTASL